MGDQKRRLQVQINGEDVRAEVPVRLLLSDFLRHEVGLTGTHVGCEHGVCGACTILLDGHAVRSCLLLAIQADGHEVRTVESLSEPNGELGVIPAAFRDQHGLQCGFCTPGIMMSLAEVAEEGGADEGRIRAAIEGHLCRCTGYRNIVRAAEQALLGTVQPEASDG